MLKVVHVSLIYFRLSENWIHTQIKYSKDYKPIVFTNKTANLNSVDWQPAIFSRADNLPIGIRELDSMTMKMIGYYPSFYWKAKKGNIDLIHAHFGPMGFLSSVLAKKMDIPLVTSFYGYDASLLLQQEPKWKLKYKKLFNYGTCFLVEGPAMKRKLENLGCPSEKITIHHLGIEPGNYPVRKKYPSVGPMRILMVGRFVEKKGFIYGLKAFRKFLSRGGEGVLTIVGDSNETTESEKIKRRLFEYVEEHEMQSSVSFAGMIPLNKLRQEYYKHDVFLAPSIEAKNGDNEGGAPVTIIEASATGMPVVGSRHCDIPEVVKNETSGLLAEEKDIKRLTQHLLRLKNNVELRRQFGKEAASLIRRQYNAVKLGNQLCTIYKSLYLNLDYS